MKRVFLAFLFLTFLSSKCDEKYLKCSDCYNREFVLKATNKMVEKILNDKIDNYKIKVEEDADFYTVNYLRNDLSSFGGGIWIKISKKDCKIVDYIRTK